MFIYNRTIEPYTDNQHNYHTSMDLMVNRIRNDTINKTVNESIESFQPLSTLPVYKSKQEKIREFKERRRRYYGRKKQYFIDKVKGV